MSLVRTLSPASLDTNVLACYDRIKACAQSKALIMTGSNQQYGAMVLYAARHTEGGRNCCELRFHSSILTLSLEIGLKQMKGKGHTMAFKLA